MHLEPIKHHRSPQTIGKRGDERIENRVENSRERSNLNIFKLGGYFANKTLYSMCKTSTGLPKLLSLSLFMSMGVASYGDEKMARNENNCNVKISVTTVDNQKLNVSLRSNDNERSDVVVDMADTECVETCPSSYSPTVLEYDLGKINNSGSYAFDGYRAESFKCRRRYKRSPKFSKLQKNMVKPLCLDNNEASSNEDNVNEEKDDDGDVEMKNINDLEGGKEDGPNAQKNDAVFEIKPRYKTTDIEKYHDKRDVLLLRTLTVKNVKDDSELVRLRRMYSMGMDRMTSNAASSAVLSETRDNRKTNNYFKNDPKNNESFQKSFLTLKMTPKRYSSQPQSSRTYESPVKEYRIPTLRDFKLAKRYFKKELSFVLLTFLDTQKGWKYTGTLLF